MIDPAVFERAAELIEAGWTQRAMARSADGPPVAYNSDRACCFCMQGAVYRASPGVIGWQNPYWAEVVARVKNPVTYNDAPERTPAEVADELRRIGREVSDSQGVGHA